MSWKDLEDEMSDELTQEFAEAIKHIPRIAVPNERSQPDPARPEQELRGIFTWLAHDVFLSKGHSSEIAPGAAHHNSRTPRLSIEVRDLVSPVKAEDWFALLERGLLFEVVSPKPDGQGRIELQLVQRGLHTIA